jgi:hypothetical protein
MTVVIHFNQLGQLAVRQTSTGLQLAAKFLAMVAGAQRSAVQRYPRQPALQIAAAGKPTGRRALLAGLAAVSAAMRLPCRPCCVWLSCRASRAPACL